MGKRRKDLVATDLARAIWRTIGYCEYCGVTNEKAQLQGAHIYGVGAYPRLRDDLRNGMSLCSVDHRRFTDNPIAFTDWVRTTKYNKYLIPLQEKNRTFEKRFWEERVAELKDIKKQLENRSLDLDELREEES